MKKIFAVILALIIALSLVGCSKSSPSLAFDNAYNGYSEGSTPKAETYSASSEEEFLDSDYASDARIDENSSASGRKLIRTVSLSMETLEFENFISALQKAVAETGGYIESSDISGNSYNYSRSRYASFTCRIPSEKLDGFLSTVGGIGNVTSSYENQDDVTLSYVDTEARVASLQTEYDRLLELLAKAENIDSVIALEQRLSDVRYQLESYKSQLRTYDNLVDYSTVTISASEVQRVTSPEEKSVWARISTDFSDNLYNVGTSLVDFFVWLVAATPYFAVFAVIVLILVLIVKVCLKNNPRHQAKVAWKKAEKARKKAEKLAKKNGAEPAEASAPAEDKTAEK